MPQATINLFLSGVTDEFGSVRGPVRDALDLPGVRVEIQEHFLPFGDKTLLMLDEYVQKCDAVIHLSGRLSGGIASNANQAGILAAHPDLPSVLGADEAFLRSLTYTQWEAWLAVYHGRRLFIAPAHDDFRPDHPVTEPAKAEAQRLSQRKHLDALRAHGHYESVALAFKGADELAIALLRTLRHRDLLPEPQLPVSPELPPSLGTLFKGRDGKLAELRRAFREARPRGGVDCCPVAIHGSPGFGKTRLAAEYAHAVAGEHSALLFVSASSPEDLDKSLAGLCGTLQLPEAHSDDRGVRVRGVRRWLDDPAHKGWFMIVDNVDDEAAFQGVDILVRSLHHGEVLLTGRIRRWQDFVTPIKLEQLSVEHAAEYLIECTTRDRVPDTDGPTADRMKAAELATELAGHALALTQAGHHIRRRRLSFRDYLAEWREHRDELLDDPDFDPTRTGYPQTMAVTWLTSYRQLPPGSALLFDAMCWLSPAPIPERLVSQDWPEAALTLLTADESTAMPRRKADLLIALYDYCLAEPPTTARRLFEIHRVQCDAGRRWQRKQEDGALALRRFGLAVELVQAGFVRPDTNANLTLHILPELRELEPHVIELLRNDGPAPIREDGQSRFYRVLCEAKLAEGALRDALGFARHAVRTGRRFRASSSPEVPTLVLVEALCVEAFCLEAGGEFRAGLASSTEALGLVTELCELESENLDYQRQLSIALSSIGRIRESQGALVPALEVFTRSEEICQRLCEREPDNLDHQRELSIALENVGRIREKQGALVPALEVFTRSVDICQRLCEREPDNLAHQRDLSIALNNLGRIREKQGALVPALEVFTRSEGIYQRLCEREPDNLAHQRELSIALSNVGRIREKQGALVPALEVFTRSVDICQRLCEREPDNLAHQRELYLALFWLGTVERKLRKLEDATQHLGRSAEIAQSLVARGWDRAGTEDDLKVIRAELAMLPPR